MVKKILRIIKKVLVYLGMLLSLVLIVLLVSIPVSKKDGKIPYQVGTHKDTYTIKNVNIIDVELGMGDYILPNRAIVVENGLIKNIVPDSVILSLEHETIDGKGKYVVPGLVDMHTHVFDRSDLAMYLGYGVTNVRNMMGFPMHLRWREQIKNGEYPGATLFTASPTLNSGNNTSPFHKNIKGTKEAAEAVKKYKMEGYDFIKIYDGLNKEEFSAIVDEAERNNLYVAGHPPHEVDFDIILGAGLNSLEHVEELIQGPMAYELDTVLGRKIVRKIKAHNSRVTVTLSPFHAIYKATVDGTPFLDSIPKEKINPFVRFIGHRQLSQWVGTNEGAYKWNTEKYHCMEALVGILNEEGVELLLGTDTGPSLTIPGITLHDEIALLHKNGIAPIDILRSGTINASKALGLNNEIGSIAIGKKADLLLLEENPLDALSTLKEPVSIVKDGVFYTKDDVKQLRGLGVDKSNTYMTIGRFLDHIIKK
ncbi:MULTISPECIES: amidohydrolase family protein [Flavobacteriaceae]|uniref:amidohydrolase family protein n=1 Tax=Flavobacteriaceae TaxID=49546 RepID=UPI0014928105|nr:MULTISPECIES: amidohydrolase family protein [Allomuricauda]MDC6366976.1 amidohydrolase family protein [Muricauda sp. AC10]